MGVFANTERSIDLQSAFNEMQWVVRLQRQFQRSQ
jgi:hypothetical protein